MEESVMEWFAFTAVFQSTSLPVYLLSGNQIAILSESIDIIQYTYLYSLDDVTKVAELSMHDLWG